VRASSSTFGWGKRVSGPESLWRPGVYVQSLLILLGGCKGEPRAAVIGYAFPLWGTTTVQVARDEIASWPAGRTAIRIVYDSIIQGDPPDIEVMRAQRLAQTPNLVGVVGHGGSRGSLAAAPIYAAAGIPQIIPTGTSRLLRQAGPWAFRLAPDDSTEGALIGRFTAERLGARRVLLFFTNDEYGVGLRDGVLAELAARDVAVLDKVGVDPSSDIPTLFAASLRRGIPDVIVVAGRHTETGRVARAALGRVPRLRVVAGDGALLLPVLADLAGPAADSIYVVAFWLPDAPDSMSRAFVERYRRVTGHDPSPDDPMNHDALMLLAHAVREVGPHRAAVRAYLESLGGTRPPYRGITGDITFLRARKPPLVMARLRGGRVVRVAGLPVP
jgi:branched-chain amino acid transport system substrate-binding protein